MTHVPQHERRHVNRHVNIWVTFTLVYIIQPPYAPLEIIGVDTGEKVDIRLICGRLKSRLLTKFCRKRATFALGDS